MQLERIQILLSQGRYEMAYKDVKELLSHEPYNDYALGMLAVCCLNLRKLDEAEQVIKEGQSRQPFNGHYKFLMANLFAMQDKLVDAAKFVNEAIELDSNSGEYWDMKARIHLAKNQFRDAERSAREALALDSEDTDALNTLSKALIGQGKKDEAAEIMDKALEVNPENWETHANYGYRSLELGQVKEAIEHFRAALINDPNKKFAQNGMKLAMKAKFPLYRWLLQFQLFMSRKGQNFNFLAVFAIMILNNVFKQLSNGSAGWLSVLFIGLMVFLVGFVLSTWILDPIMTFVLYLRKNGRLSLDDDELNTAKFVQWNLILILCGIVAYFIFGNITWANLFLAGFIGLVCSTGMWENVPAKRRKIPRIFYIVACGFFLSDIVASVVYQMDDSIFMVLGIMTGVAYSWAGNSLFNKA